MREPAPGAAHPRLLGAQWDELGFRQLGWRLMPLRGFLGVTFLYAALQKLANPDYLHASAPASFVAQTHALESTSPIAPLLRLSLHAPTLAALLIALGELAVALGIIFGLWTRLAAVGGMVLSLTFFLTVSWSTTPYFYGSDIVFAFAWSVFVMCGADGVLCVDAWIAERAGHSRHASLAPVDVVRRQLLVGARSAGILAVLGGTLAGFTALVGRAVGGTKQPTAGVLTRGTPVARHRLATVHPATHRSTQPPSTTPTPTESSPSRHHPAAQPSGTALGPASAVPVGQGRQFTDPKTGQPAWLLRPSSSTVAAFSAVCTHAGCTVGYDAGAGEFVCPCHGGTYSATTGAVLGGPPPAPLARIPARIVKGEIRVD